MRLTIVVPYENAGPQTPVWAGNEATIDFRHDPFRGCRCTLAFAAMELKQHLERTLQTANIAFAESAPGDGTVFIELSALDPASKDDGFEFEPRNNGVQIRGTGRTGVLYGVYELLRLQGWRWLYPGTGGEVVPPARDELALPRERQSHKAVMDLGRGFDFEGPLKEDPELWLWMARNRLNVAIHRQETGPLLNKLGMTFKIGGHIFERILGPDRVMPSGRTLWDEHEDWYGLPPSGEREKARALGTQFCVTRPDLIDFLAEELLRRLIGDWCDADRVDVWGFDTWGNTCTCTDCAALGNSTDQTLHFLSGLRTHIDAARSDGRLDHDVTMIACAYEGTATIFGPEHAFPENLIAAGDMVVYYPINRCYRHTFDDPKCDVNKQYHEALASWFSHTPHMPVCIGEYYNVSKFEDLPLLFTKTMSNDIPAYQRLGATGITYMHLPMVNWAMRAVTQLAYADLAWHGGHDRDAFVTQYLADRYGPHANDMAIVYARIEDAWLDAADWRAWSARSILSELRRWDGKTPTKPLGADTHFKTPAGMIAAGERSLQLLNEAKDGLDTVRKRDMACPSGSLAVVDGVNPADVARAAAGAELEMRLSEDRRLLLYGIDTMAVMTGLARYHTALFNGDDASEADAAWTDVEAIADRLDSYYIPIRFGNPTPTIESRDALTRSQVRELLRRIRAARTSG